MIPVVIRVFAQHNPGEVILQAVRWYLRYPLAYEHVAELLAERGLGVDASCVWRWVQAYSPELNYRYRSHLKPHQQKLPSRRNLSCAEQRVAQEG